MYTLRHVSVPHDFSTCARLALDYATFIGEPVEVLHQWQGPRWGHQDPEPLVLFARSRDRKELEECLAGLALRCPSRGQRQGAGGCQLTLRVGATDDYDFIVLGSHNTATRRTVLLMGHVAKKLAGTGIDRSDARLRLVSLAEIGAMPNPRQLSRTRKMEAPILPAAPSVAPAPGPGEPSDSEPHSD
jgi:hypothetical protein